MQIVIEIDELSYEVTLMLVKAGEGSAADIAVANGTPLPKGHGRLIDADAEAKKWGLDKATKYGNEDAEQQHFSYSSMMMYEIADILDDAEVILEADKEVSYAEQPTE